jgi:hypothetical protein
MPEIKIPEGAIVNACIRWLFLHRCFVWRNNSGALQDKSGRVVRFGKVGSSDIIGLTRYGRFVGVECKAKGNKQSPEQSEFERLIRYHNGIYILAYSVDDLEARKHEIANQPKETI